MNEKIRDQYIKTLESIIEYYLTASEPEENWVHILGAEENELRDIGERRIISHSIAHGFNVQSINAILKICPLESVYHQEALEIYKTLGHYPVDFSLYNLLCRVRDDLKLGFIGKISSLLHQEIFTDYLDMAQHLLDEGYKDAAAVITGSTLESHLKQLCNANQVDIDEVKKDGTKQPKKASRLNDDLKKKGVYSLYDQKMVTAQLDLRNNAAHGKYSLYTDDQVIKFIDWLRDFIDRNPA